MLKVVLIPLMTVHALALVKFQLITVETIQIPTPILIQTPIPIPILVPTLILVQIPTQIITLKQIVLQLKELLMLTIWSVGMVLLLLKTVFV